MNMAQNMTLVIALGGNAWAAPSGDARGAFASPDGAAEVIAGLVELGYKVVVTHGNGPQVGYALLKDVAAPLSVPHLSLASLGAQTEGELGSLVSLAIRGALERRKLTVPVTTILTHSVVDPTDPEARESTKPIGPVFHDKAEAEKASRITGLVAVADRDGQRLAVP